MNKKAICFFCTLTIYSLGAVPKKADLVNPLTGTWRFVSMKFVYADQRKLSADDLENQKSMNDAMLESKENWLISKDMRWETEASDPIFIPQKVAVVRNGAIKRQGTLSFSDKRGFKLHWADNGERYFNCSLAEISADSFVFAIVGDSQFGANERFALYTFKRGK